MAESADRLMAMAPLEGGFGQGQLYGGAADRGSPFIGGLLSAVNEAHDVPRIDESKKRLARRANEIYRSICDELQLSECFFHGFGAWSEFVEGRMSEVSFYAKAREEAEVLAGRNN